eukprot:5030479-Pyramimonas_sp.AAC.2
MVDVIGIRVDVIGIRVDVIVRYARPRERERTANCSAKIPQSVWKTENENGKAFHLRVRVRLPDVTRDRRALAEAVVHAGPVDKGDVIHHHLARLEGRVGHLRVGIREGLHAREALRPHHERRQHDAHLRAKSEAGRRAYTQSEGQ